MNEKEYSIIQSIETFTSFLSLISSIIIIFKLFYLPNNWKLTTKQLVILSFIDFFNSIFFSIGHSGQGNHYFCEFQGFMIQWGSLANVFWISAMAYHLYHWIALKKNEEKLNKKMRKTAIFSICISFLISIIMVGAGVFGKATMWCWIKDKYQWVRFVFFYGIVIIAWIYVIYILSKVGTAVSGGPRLSFRKSAKLALAGTGIQFKIRQYIFVFIFTWFFGLLNRIVEAAIGHPVFATSVLHALFVPLQGFLNSLVYGGLLIDIINFIKSFKEKSSEGNTTPSGSPIKVNDIESQKTASTELNEVPHFGDRQPTPSVGRNPPKRSSKKSLTRGGLPIVPYTSRKVSIFLSSFNQGEAPMNDLEDMKSWILDGHDIYVIGVQECLCLEEFRNRMHQHLGGSEKFKMHTCEIGSSNTRLGFHGFIALTVFIKTEDIENGNIKMTESSSNDLANGTDLIVTTAANKGAVGLPFQIHDTSIGFVTVHLPSDSKGKSKLPRRNAAAQEMLREVVLASEDVGCDMQLQHDHLIILGDLNYRMNTPAIQKNIGGKQSGIGEGQSALLSIASAAFAERSALRDDPFWIQRKYGLFYGPDSPNCIPKEERDFLKTAEQQAASSWDAILQYDEMIKVMASGEVFFGFKEVPPRFPPTYKRKKGAAGDCGDYTSFSDLVQGYSHTGEETNETDDLDDSTRSTSSMGSLSELDTSLSGISGSGNSISSISNVNENITNSGNSGNNTNSFSSVNSNNGNESKRLSKVMFDLDVSNNGSNSENLEEKKNNDDDSLQNLPSLSRLTSQDSETMNNSNNGNETNLSTKSSGDTPQQSPSERPKVNRRGSMFNLRRGSIMGGFDEEKKKEEKRKSKLRPPSYTDRIIVHSLVENEKLVPEAYGFCDTYRASDHRAVCMTMTLEVNSCIKPSKHIADDIDSTELSQYSALLQLKIKGLQSIFIDKEDSVSNPLLGGDNNSNNNISGGNSNNNYNTNTNNEDILLRKEDLSNSRALMKRMSNPISETEQNDSRHSRQSTESSSIPSSPPQSAPVEKKKPQRRASMFPIVAPTPQLPPTVAEIVVVFPLPSKDPLIEYRKMYNFIKAFQVGDDSGLRILHHRSSKLKEELLKVKKSYPWSKVTGTHEIEVDSCVDISLGVDALIKIIDTNGQDMGQAYLNLNPFLSPDKLGIPQTLQVPISSGGQYKGTLTGTFSLSCLQEQISLG